MQFEASCWIDAPVESVFAFHRRSDALDVLSPPGEGIQILKRPRSLDVGETAEFRIPVGPFRVRWVAEHVAYEENRMFTDRQVRGPFRSWVHTHRFEAEGTGTRLTDHVDLSLPGGRLAEQLCGWLVRQKLEALFRYRHATTRHYTQRATKPSA